MGRPSAERGSANATCGSVQTLCKFSRMRLKKDVFRERTESMARRVAGIPQPSSPLVFCCRIHHKIQLRAKTKAAPMHIRSRLKFKRLLCDSKAVLRTAGKSLRWAPESERSFRSGRRLAGTSTAEQLQSLFRQVPVTGSLLPGYSS